MKHLLLLFFVGCATLLSPLPSTAHHPQAVSTDQRRLEQILAHQPDFTAAFALCETDQRKPVVSGKLAQKSGQFRIEVDDCEAGAEKTSPSNSGHRGKTIYLERENLPSVEISEARREYAAEWWSPEYDEKETFAGFFKSFLHEADTQLKITGTRPWDGHPCTIIEVRQNDQTITLYSADDLKGLIIRAEIVEAQETTTIDLRNVSFEVDDSLFVIPAGYLENRTSN